MRRSLVALVATGSAFVADAQQFDAPAHVPAIRERKTVRVVAIGDFGSAGDDELAVAQLVHALAPDAVITLGDNNYPDGEAATIDANVGQYYHDFIAPYVGTFGAGATHNRFFPSLGNHDWVASGALPYLAYFALPGNERYYHFVLGPVHLFALDSDPHEPDGIEASSVQGAWLQSALATSTAPFQVVYFHHAPYSSAQHGQSGAMHWPFRAWGADLVLAGHDHAYERVMRDGFPYLVNGLGGAARYAFGTPVAGSQLRHNAGFGALVLDATPRLMTVRFVSVGGAVMDTLTLTPTGVDYVESELLPAGSTWKYLDDGSNAGTAWRNVGFDDSTWSSGPAELGYGDGGEATTVSFGPNASDKHITTYFRRTFTAPDPATLRAVRMELVRDDGAIVYLDGAQIWRSNMPDGTVSSESLAASSANDAEESSFYTIDMPLASLGAGSHLLAVEVHQRDPTSSDVSFDLRVVATLEDVRLSPRQSIWKYRDTGTPPPSDWASPAFDDASWSSGPAQLGYGDGDEATVVSYGPDAANKHITTWFRRSFTVADASAHADGLLLKLLCDDGAAVYLNGVDVYRRNVPFADLAATSTAEISLSGSDETSFVETLIDARLLVDGVNTLAVEVHQVNGQSSDLSFDLELIGL